VRSDLKRAAALGAVIAAVAGAGIGVASAATPGLDEQIDSAQSEASLISERINAQARSISELEAQAAGAAAREAELQAQLREAETRSRELGTELAAARRELEAVRARYARSVAILADRLVAIYTEPQPDPLAVVLEASDFGELQERAEYLEQLTDADERIAARVEELRGELEGRYEKIESLKAEIDQRARELEDARGALAAERAAAESRSGRIAAARAEGQRALAELQERIMGWELEARRAAAREIAEGGGEMFAGGPYSIPTYIVMCESGGNYRALNPSSGAGGAYQIIPSTWRAYGGKGLPHLASTAEQDRIAAIIWREDGPGAWSCA
jgi:peptidoglycan hydrolase CwlO-like protein